MVRAKRQADLVDTSTDRRRRSVGMVGMVGEGARFFIVWVDKRLVHLKANVHVSDERDGNRNGRAQRGAGREQTRVQEGGYETCYVR